MNWSDSQAILESATDTKQKGFPLGPNFPEQLIAPESKDEGDNQPCAEKV